MMQIMNHSIQIPDVMFFIISNLSEVSSPLI